MFRRFSIGYKLVAILIVPVLSLIFFASTAVMQRLRTQHETTTLQELSQLAVALSAFVHEAQKERGATGVFMGSQGKQFRDEVSAQRALTDKKAAPLNAIFARFDVARFGPAFQQHFDVARREFYDKLGSHRAAVDALAIPGREGIGYYTQMNAAWLDVVTHISTLSANAALANQVLAYVNFLHGKEKTGVERATMANAFGRGKYESHDEFQRFVTAAISQDAFLKAFLSLASDEQRAFYHARMQGTFVDESARMRAIAFKSANQPDLGGVDAPHWFDMMTGKINLMKEVEDQLSVDLTATADQLHREARADLVLFTAIAVGAIVIAGLLAYIIARGIVTPLQQMVAILQDMAQGEGDLTRRLAIASRDELGTLSQWFNTFMDKLHDIIGQVCNTATHVATVAQQLSGASQQLATGAQQQAASLEETAATLEQITSTVKQTAANARQADHLAAGSRDAAHHGGQVVAAAVTAMDEIRSSSRKITDIASTIDTIAFQTNLLALNAAVEAARAGDQGRGFAVVAAEVRNLSQRSATAAREVKTLLQDSGQKVLDGAKLVNKSGQTLAEIMGSANQVTDIIAEIATASQEQASGIEQVYKAMTQMDQATQQNTAQVEALTATAQELAARAQDIQTLVGKFQLNQTTANPGVAPVAEPPLTRAPVTRGQRPQAEPGAARRASAMPDTMPRLEQDLAEV